MKEWISVDDRLPGDGQDVIALDVECGAFCSCVYRGGGIFESVETGEDFNDGNFVVTYWMSLPEPPN